MILSCPSCSTRYSVDETTLGEAGRKVRCAACGHTWHVSPGAKTASGAASAAPLQESESLRPLPKDSARAWRDKVEARRRRRWAMVGGGAWAAVAATLLVLITAAWMFRLDIVRAWPQSASAYAALGTTANIYGLALEDAAARRVTVDGEPVLEIQTRLRNIDREPRAVPLVRFALHSENGEEVFAWTVQPEAGTLEPGEQAAVVTQLIEPPVQALEVVLTLTETPVRASSVHKPEEAEAEAAAPAQAAPETTPAETDIAVARDAG